MISSLFSGDRMDTFVLEVSIAIPVVLVVCLVLWHLVRYTARQVVPKRQRRLAAPEPSATPSLIKNDPERLQQACAALVESLAERYLQLADCWSQQGQPKQAAAALRELVQRCPETRQAQIAQERLKDLATDQHR